MTNGELLRQLFRGHVKRDDVAFTAAAEEIVHEERMKNHRLLADDLERILLNGNGRKREAPLNRALEIPKDRERGFPLFTVSEFDYSWDRLILPSKTLHVLEQVAREYRRCELLASAGIRPKQRLLFYGPPGCGKTMTAKVLSGVMNYPLITVRFDAIISSYLGETAANLRRVFEFIEHGQWIVLFDEFDAIGKERDNPFDHGELKRVVNSLLQLMDAYGGLSLLIAATNHEGLLDTAVWRRFELVVPFSRPTLQSRVLLLRTFLRGVDTSRLDFEATARKLNGATGADVEQVAIECVRRALIDGKDGIHRDDLASSVAEFRERMRLMREMYAVTKTVHPSEIDSPSAAKPGED